MVTMVDSDLNVNNVITHEYNVDEYIKCFEMMKSGKVGKFILNWE